MSAARLLDVHGGRRGQPLVALMGVLALWVGVRACLLTGSTVSQAKAGGRDMAAGAPQAVPHAVSRSGARQPTSRGAAAYPARAVSAARPRSRPAEGARSATALPLQAGLAPTSAEPAMDERAAGGPFSLVGSAGSSAAGASRWSGDGWLYLRRGHGAPALGTLGPTYGASQFGAVLRYALAPGPRARAFGYLRFAGAIDAPFRDRHLALGLGLRPVRRLPVAVLVEARVQQVERDTHVRPAVALVSEVPPLALPLGAEAEIYGQGGWVGGQDATAFFDLQAVADRRVLRPSVDADLRLGAGVWSGGQKGAVRLDAGPRVSLRTAIGSVPARLALDWRFRVAGDAAPRSGPALTVSAGF